MKEYEAVDGIIDGFREDMVEFARRILSVPAMAPESGGVGEMEKADLILELVKDWGFDSVDRFYAPDDRVPGGKRPNYLLTLKGEDSSPPRVWLFAHTDVVPPGDLDKWTGDPWTLRVDGDRITARGVEDNGQDLISGVFAARALTTAGIRPKHDVKIFLVADEEVGSAKGMHYLVDNHSDLFSEEDLYLVPDAGEPDGSMIEVAEKSIMWLRIKTIGKQVHASTPGKGINANLAAMRLMVSIYDELHERYGAEDELFDPAGSTFEPTKRESNVPNINTIPGEDISYLDCRILPEYDPEEILDLIKARGGEIGERYGVKFEFSTHQYEKAAPPTSPDHPVVGILADAVRDVYGIEAKPMGIGGGTCAAILRRKGYKAAVWSKMEDAAHMPDEFALVSNYIGDAKVFARIFIGR
ncbi:MAG: M20 family metallo-hydrolase [Thermoplasmatota archaeon]